MGSKMNYERIDSLYNMYRDTLLYDIVPFWLRHSLDWKHGGYMSWVDRDGSLLSTDKSVWIQGRGVWIFSRMCNEFGYKKEWLEAAKLGYDFLKDHCYDSDGRLFFQVTREGKPLRKRRYLFSEAFAAAGCAEYARASNDTGALEKAKETYRLLLDYYMYPEKLEPKIIKKTRQIKSHAMPMIMIATSQALREVDYSTDYDRIINSLITEVLSNFVHKDKKALLENVGINGEFIDNPQGRLVNPGHSMETSWFLMEEGRRQNNRDIIQKALEILDWSLELGWDKEYGGILYFVDIGGKPPEQLEWDMKLWWPHNEALYSLLLAYHITHDRRYSIWYEKVHEYTFSHFPDEIYGEWYGYLHRDGSISSPIKGNMWKGLFHVPRQYILTVKLLGEMLESQTFGCEKAIVDNFIDQLL